MAVPSSGSLSLFGIYKELTTNTYTTTYDGANNISIRLASIGTYGAINTNNATADRPNGSPPHAMSEFYNYDHDKSGVTSGTLYYDSNGPGIDGEDVCIYGTSVTVYWNGSGDPISNGYDIYTTSALSTKAASGAYASFIGSGTGIYEYWDNLLGWAGAGTACGTGGSPQGPGGP